MKIKKSIFLFLTMACLMVFISSCGKEDENKIDLDEHARERMVTVFNEDREIKQSGFFIDENGTILTEYSNVFLIAYELSVKLSDGEVYPVTSIVDYDIVSDVLALKIDLEGTPYFKAGTEDVKVGDNVYVGNALVDSSGSCYTIGKITSTEHKMGGINYLESDGNMTNGSRGGPLMNDKGEYVGINLASIKLDGEEVGNMNISIPLNLASQLKNDKNYIPLEYKGKLIEQVVNSYHAGNRNTLVNTYEKVTGKPVVGAYTKEGKPVDEMIDGYFFSYELNDADIKTYMEYLSSIGFEPYEDSLDGNVETHIMTHGLWGLVITVNISYDINTVLISLY